METYEYIILDVDLASAPQLTALLNALGAEGWRLVYGQGLSFVFARERAERFANDVATIDESRQLVTDISALASVR